ncbi:MAG: glycosyltransferase [Syntrophothermus sp.]
MKIYMFYHSVISDWNNGNAHFLRGMISALTAKGHKVQVYEPADGWSLKNLLDEQGLKAYYNFRKYYPAHTPVLYNEDLFNPSEHLLDADLVIVHEWNNPKLVKKLGDFRAKSKSFTLLFHDTHHRAVTDPMEMQKFDLSGYDGILASGDAIRDIYLENRWAVNAWTWHEAADLNIFHPMTSPKMEGDLVWIGNWGDEERTEELEEFLIKPSRDLKLKTTVYGVRYPEHAKQMLKKAKITYKGWIPNFKVPEVYSKYRVTMNIPRKPYVEKLQGIPAIRMFEAMACGIPLLCSPWKDTEKLFRGGKDYLVAQNGEEMKENLLRVLHDQEFSTSLYENAMTTILDHHTCDHRAEELETILNHLRPRNIPSEKLLVNNTEFKTS